ncbi:MAG: hypothetical protein KJ955_01975 [Nanoarchaeota archaeon]|nr:hypothetical protein [Nanoarchaeota archaeon]
MGCGGGDTEGELEKKARRGLKWYDALGAAVLAAAVTGFFAGATGYRLGHDKGYNEGIYEGHEAGVAEEQQQAPKVKIQLMPLGHQYFVFFSAKQNKGGENITYRLRASPNKVYPGELGEEPHIDITQVSEEIHIERADGTNVNYTDGDLGVQTINEYCMAGPRDGLVDAITVHQPGKGVSLLCRVRDYDANPTVFDKADALFKEVRGQFFSLE